MQEQMNSFILIAKSPTKQQEYLDNFAAQHNISPFDVTIIMEEGSVGIEIVRKLHETLFLKPYKRKEKMIVIEAADALTVTAQNALLKTLEEPPVHAYLFLCSKNEDMFLPTVLSRCSIIQVDTSVILTRPESDIQMLEEQLQAITNGPIAEKLALAESLAADKENLITWFEQMTYALREKMTTDASCAAHLQTFHEAYKTLTTTNVNARTILEHCFLSM